MTKKKETTKEKKKVPFNVFRKGAIALALAGIIATPVMLTGCSGEKGDAGEKGEKGEQGIQGIQGIQGVQGETGKSIVDVDIVYEYKEDGSLWAVYTFIYSDGTTSEERAKVPKKLTSISQLTFGEYNYLYQYAKVASKDDTPTLYTIAQFDDGSSGKVVVTEDMFVKTGGYKVPDFTKVGDYNYKISYYGRETDGFLRIEDISKYQVSMS